MSEVASHDVPSNVMYCDLDGALLAAERTRSACFRHGSQWEPMV